ncbi:hypothetical protein ACGFZB_28885 [Streptomyces cinerochromogenes]|uniref:Secreted protein n=1 Tax=Streptomyces cinerochromogenes TaxID=66422 RepID=A0ABW7BBX7_9ACTN
MSFTDVTPWALVALVFLLALVVVVAGAVVALIAVAGRAPHKSKPDIIRALAEFWKALLESLFRWRRK